MWAQWGPRDLRYGSALQTKGDSTAPCCNILWGLLAQGKTGDYSASATRMRPSPSLRLSASDVTPSPPALRIIIIISSRLDRNLHGHKVVCRHGFAFRLVNSRFRSKFNWNLAESSSPCLTGLSFDLTNYGNSFARVRTRGRGGESTVQVNRGCCFWGGGGGDTAPRISAIVAVKEANIPGADVV